MSKLNTVTRAAGTASTTVVTRGIGPLGILGVIFVLCKIFAVAPIAAWSWWLVLLPFYIGILLAVGIWVVLLAGFAVVVGCVFAFYGLAELWDKWKYRKYRRKRSLPIKGRSF